MLSRERLLCYLLPESFDCRRNQPCRLSPHAQGALQPSETEGRALTCLQLEAPPLMSHWEFDAVRIKSVLSFYINRRTLPIATAFLSSFHDCRLLKASAHSASDLRRHLRAEFGDGVSCASCAYGNSASQLASVGTKALDTDPLCCTDPTPMLLTPFNAA